MNSLASILMVEGKFSEAEKYRREALDERRRAFGEADPDTLLSMMSVAMVLDAEGKVDESETNMREALEMCRRALGNEARYTLFETAALGALLRDHGKLDEAERFLREALDSSRRVLGPNDPTTLYALVHLAGLFVARGKPGEAEKLLAPLEAQARSGEHSPASDALVVGLMNLGRARTMLGEYALAEPDLVEAQPTLSASGPYTRIARQSTVALVDLYTAWNIAEPGKGHDAKAAAWKQKLDVMHRPNPH